MLNDMFFRRYADVPIWTKHDDVDQRLLVQLSQLVTQDVHPVGDGKSERGKGAAVALQATNDALCREIGQDTLSPAFSTSTLNFNGKLIPHSYSISISSQISTYLKAPMPYGILIAGDAPIKHRISLVEFAFRIRAAQLRDHKSMLIASVINTAATTFENIEKLHNTDWRKKSKARLIAEERAFGLQVQELNTRFAQAFVPLSYNNGFIQKIEDQLLAREVERPFWAIVADPKWASVDQGVQEAIDKRDRGERDCVSPALGALESTIKIISGDKGWTTGAEKGASHYIDNLVKQRAGVRFIDVWEMEALKRLFTDVRNVFGHGPGAAPLPTLQPEQSSWAIEVVMVWIRSLVRRT